MTFRQAPHLSTGSSRLVASMTAMEPAALAGEAEHLPGKARGGVGGHRKVRRCCLWSHLWGVHILLQTQKACSFLAFARRTSRVQPKVPVAFAGEVPCAAFADLGVPGGVCGGAESGFSAGRRTVRPHIEAFLAWLCRLEQPSCWRLLCRGPRGTGPCWRSTPGVGPWLLR